MPPEPIVEPYTVAAYFSRRILYMVPVWLGVFFITFALFHFRDPLAIARVHRPQAPLPVLQAWIRNNNLHLPMFLNLPSDATTERADGRVHPELAERGLFYSQFFLSVQDMLFFRFGMDKNRKPIKEAMIERIGPSLSLMLPAFLLSLFFSVSVALLVSYFHQSRLDYSFVFISVLGMSIALPTYLIASNYLFGKIIPLMPIYNSVLLPVVISVVASVGGQIRFYRTVFLDQINQDYVRTARARGLAESQIMVRHVLRNSLIPILTSIVMQLPFLITGSLLLEQFFGIPGMGDMLFSAITGQDFQVIKVMVYMGSFLYMIGSLLTDLSYVLADPRVVLR
ncbi:MAG: ABC transporter permease [Spirochaetales bacterium]|nr:ABC transporter permease [Spirochaetales bacterium]